MYNDYPSNFCRIFSFLTILVLFSACSEEVALEKGLGECMVGYGYQGTVAEEWNEKSGTIKAPDEYCPVYTIVDVPGLLEAEDLFPCNLPEEYKQDGLKIIFSGYLFEIPENVDICSYAFQLTKIKISSR